MSKNLIPEIAKLLGVEIGEEFRIRIVDSGNEIKHTFRFTEESLEYYDNNVKEWEWDGHPTLYDLIAGVFEIVKLPWKPKYNEMYFTYSSSWNAHNVYWTDCFHDYKNLKIGAVFRTEEEAIRERPHIYKQLTGKEWEEENG